MTKTQALLSGTYVHLDMYKPLSTSMQDMVKTHREVTECDVMPAIDTMMRGLLLDVSIDTVHFVTPEGMNPEFSANIAPMFILDSYAAAAEDGMPDFPSARDQILTRAMTAFHNYGTELKRYVDEHLTVSHTDTSSEVQE